MLGPDFTTRRRSVALSVVVKEVPFVSWVVGTILTTCALRIAPTGCERALAIAPRDRAGPTRARRVHAEAAHARRIVRVDLAFNSLELKNAVHDSPPFTADVTRSDSEREAGAIIEDLVQGSEYAAGPCEVVRRQAKILVSSEEHTRVICDCVQTQGLKM